MVLHFKILLSLAIVATAEAILIRIGCSQVLDVDRAVSNDLALFCADFDPICPCSVRGETDGGRYSEQRSKD